MRGAAGAGAEAGREAGTRTRGAARAGADAGREATEFSPAQAETGGATREGAAGGATRK